MRGDAQIAGRGPMPSVAPDERSLTNLAVTSFEGTNVLRSQLSGIIQMLNPRPEKNPEASPATPASIKFLMSEQISALDDCHRMVEEIRRQLFN